MQNILLHYVVDFDPFAIRFGEGFYLEGIRWYGLSYLAGFVIALLLLNLYSSKGKSPLSKDDNSTLITYLLFGVLLGGRLGYMFFYDIDNFISNPLISFQVWKGGMASHGGFIGVVIAAMLYSKKHNIGFLRLADFMATVSSPGIFLGRLANFINGELYGKVSDAYVAMIFPNSAPRGTPIEDIAPRHASQLYEAFAEGLLLFLILQYRFWRCKLPKGQIGGEFLVLYGIFRIICEIFREPDFGISLIMGISRGQFYSIFAIIAGVIVIFLARYFDRK